MWYGEAGFLGYGTFEVTINSQGEFEKNKLIVFYPADDGQVSDEKKYTNFIKDTPLASLLMGDAIGKVSNLYLCKNKTTMILASQFKEMMEDILCYAKDES